MSAADDENEALFERRRADSQTMVLLQHHRTLAEQMAELAIAQRAFERQVPQLIADALTEALRSTLPSAEELQWVRLAIKEQGKRSARTDAIIEKSLAGLVWAMLLGLGFAVWEYLRAHLGVR